MATWIIWVCKSDFSFLDHWFYIFSESIGYRLIAQERRYFLLGSRYLQEFIPFSNYSSIMILPKKTRSKEPINKSRIIHRQTEYITVLRDSLRMEDELPVYAGGILLGEIIQGSMSLPL